MIRLTGDKPLVAALTAKVKITAEVETKVAYWGHTLEAGIKSRAPVKTGDYRRSWSTSISGGTATVGTNKPQARRLEYGFVGTDSAGRHYNQGPRPHVRPAFESVRAGFLADMAKVVST